MYCKKLITNAAIGLQIRIFALERNLDHNLTFYRLE